MVTVLCKISVNNTFLMESVICYVTLNNLCIYHRKVGDVSIIQAYL